jgi:hypothetical protein
LEESEGEGDGEACNLSCLVAVGRVQPQISAPFSSNFTANLRRQQPKVRIMQFISRHAMDGKFLFVDQRLVPERSKPLFLYVLLFFSLMIFFFISFPQLLV